MTKLRRHLLAVPIGFVILIANTAHGQAYPTRPIRLVTGTAGGGSDLTTRLIVQAIGGALGQPLVVDNRPTGIIPGQIVARANPDGQTLLISGDNLWIGPLLQTMRYDPLKTYTAITSIDTSPDVLVVHPSVPATSVKELIALARSKPGVLNYAEGAAGGEPHLAAELFNAMAGVKIVRVSYKGGGPALNGLLGAEVQLMFATPSSAMPHVKSGRLHGLAVSGAAQTALAPGLPTVADAGLPGYESTAVRGLFAPAKTPMAIVNRLNQEFVHAINRTDVKEKFFASGTEASPSTPEEFSGKLKADVVKWGKVIKDAGIHVD